MQEVLIIHPADSVAVAVTALPAGATVCGVTLRQAIPAGHKFARVPIAAGADVIKYGFPIGHAVCAIAPGEWVHSHNLKTNLAGTLSYEYRPNWTAQKASCGRTFRGYRRADGRVGIRNEVWIIPTVGCVNAIARQIETAAQSLRTGSIDGIYAYTHPYGCSQLGDDQLRTQKALSGLIRHPNAGAVLVLGLGCENNGIDALRAVLGPVDPERVQFLNCADEPDEVAAALALLRPLCARAAEAIRTECPVSDLVLGLKCGGSDGFSGITANPLLGRLTDRLTAAGGTALLTEVPEMFGAETILMNRCRSEAVFRDTVALINDFKSYFLSYGQPVGENPSPGNKAGGITTLEEKSLGCIQKGGSAPVSSVLRYGDPVAGCGLHLLQSPGNDLVSAAALAMSGAQLVLFTTGRGTPFACPVPTMKISSNSALAARKPDWIDFDAGQLLNGVPMDTLADQLMDRVIAIASGTAHTHAESLDKHDLAIFKDGVTL